MRRNRRVCDRPRGDPVIIGDTNTNAMQTPEENLDTSTYNQTRKLVRLGSDVEKEGSEEDVRDVPENRGAAGWSETVGYCGH
jgi:hypothetical protein